MRDVPVEFGITAFAACNGLGRTTSEVLSGLRAGRRGLRPCPLPIPFDVPCGVVPDPLPAPPRELASFDARQFRIAWLGIQDLRPALEDALVRFGATRVGLILGTSTGGLAEGESAYLHWKAHGEVARDYLFETQHAFHAFGEGLRRSIGIAGPSYVLSTACSSSAKVFASARRLLRTRRCDAVVVGGVDSLCFTTIRGFHSLGVAAHAGCRPFSSARDGMNVGEGAAFALLERDVPHAVRLLGIGEGSDAFHMSAPHPEGRGAERAIRAALADAKLEPHDIDYVNAHGTGTLRNDSAEAVALASVFGRDVPVVSTKSYTGHLLGASGATEALFSIAAIQEGFIPANLDLDPVDPTLPLCLPATARHQPVRHVLSTSFAFGGSNIALVFGAGAQP